MNTFVLTIGDELLSGRTLDTNGAYIGKQLSLVGAPARSRATVGDDVAQIVQTIRQAQSDHDVLIITGGLGPTHDDVTVEAIAQALSVSITTNEEVLKGIKARYSEWNRPMPEGVARMAQVPDGSQVLKNLWGTAPGLYLQSNHRHIFVLPGVPREMRGLLDASVIPIIESLPGLEPVHTRAIATSGISESALAEKLRDLMPPDSSAIKVAYLPGYGGVEMRFTSQKDPDAVEKLATQVIERIGLHFVGDATQDDLVGHLARMLMSRNETIATAESCTGGLIGKLLTDRPGSSEYFLGGVVVYSNEIKQNLLGVPGDTLVQYGAVSAQTAEAMAKGARDRMNATYAVSVTGIAGPGGGTDEKPVGLVFLGLATDQGTFSRQMRLTRDREQNRLRSAYSAIDFLRRHITSRS
jgi:nicotinamide-nucleotide amidase